jgi:hypothetical protein
VKKIIFWFLVVFCVFSVSSTKAQNNKFGMHIAVPMEEELKEVAKLVNSSGGDWGYVTVVMQSDDLNHDKWQDVFDRMRELHLIPIVRLASEMSSQGYWERPKQEEIDRWVEFLESLNWVVKKRYVVLFNEPNQGKEWGGAVDPQGYAQYTYQLAKKLKQTNEDYFLMLAGFDSAAPSQPPNYQDQGVFLRQMNESVELKEFFNYVDGLASHAYPNYGFVGSPYDSGRNSIMNYEWELRVLRNLGVDKDLPVYITETGWPHLEGVNSQVNYYSADQVADYYQIYFNRILPDERVKAITPFIFNYQEDPFDNFSWKKPGDNGYYPQYEVVKAIEKEEGDPEQVNRVEIKELPSKKLIRNSTYKFDFKLFNRGQAIWDRDQGYRITLVGENSDQFEYFFSDLTDVHPGDFKEVSLFLKTKQKIGTYELSFVVTKDDEVISNRVDWTVEIKPSINLKVSIAPFFWKRQKGENFEFLIYDPHQEVVFRKNNLIVDSGQAKVKKIENITFDQEYRLVLVRPKFLPRQTFYTFKDQEENQVLFEPLWPIDFNSDGKFSWVDIKTVLYSIKRMKEVI